MRAVALFCFVADFVKNLTKSRPGGPEHARAAAVKVHKELAKNWVKFVQYYYLTFPSPYGIIYVSRGEARGGIGSHIMRRVQLPILTSMKDRQKNFQKSF